MPPNKPRFCLGRGVDLAASDRLPLRTMARLDQIDLAAEALISPDALRQEFFGHTRLVTVLYRAIMCSRTTECNPSRSWTRSNAPPFARLGPALFRPEIRVAALLQLGDTAGARAFLSRRDIADASRAGLVPQLAYAFAALGDRDRALSALLSARNWGLSSAAVYEADPTWAPFRNDLRFKRMMQVLRERDR